jgi:hypothetical protein
MNIRLRHWHGHSIGPRLGMLLIGQHLCSGRALALITV